MRRFAQLAGCIAVLGVAFAVTGVAQERQVYRYIDADGRTVYSDRLPQGAAKEVQQKRLGASFVENSEAPFAVRQAAERYPVTLFTFDCGDTCQNAEGLLNKRGVPFSKVNVEDPAGAQRLQQLTGEMSAPVLQVGDKLVAKGFNEPKWQALLDEAGYPKTPPNRRTPMIPPGGAASAGASPTSNPPPATASATPQVGGAYPK